MQSVSIRVCVGCTDTHSELKPRLGRVAQLFEAHPLSAPFLPQPIA